MMLCPTNETAHINMNEFDDIGEKEPQYETAYAKFQNWQNLHILKDYY